MIKKILGYVLLGIGLALIILVAFQSYNIFSGKVVPPEIFKNQTQTIKGSQNSQAGNMDIQKEFQNALQKQIGDIIPKDSGVKALNLLGWSTLAWILIFAGSQIAQIGSKLLV